MHAHTHMHTHTHYNKTLFIIIIITLVLCSDNDGDCCKLLVLCYCSLTELEEDLDAAVRTIRETAEDAEAAVSYNFFFMHLKESFLIKS